MLRREFLKKLLKWTIVSLALIGLAVIILLPAILSRGPLKINPPVPTKPQKRETVKKEFTPLTVNKTNRPVPSEKKKADTFEEELGNVKLEMFSIPEGSFPMGSKKGEPSEAPEHPVTVKPFYMSRLPVTQEQWERVAKFPKVKRHLNPKPSTFTSDSSPGYLPVETVSWDEAVEFCARLTEKFGSKYGGEYRLPSEAQWEYACRAGAVPTTPFYFGETIAPDVANYDTHYSYGSGRIDKTKYNGKTTEVKLFAAPNNFGLEHMHGNVWEWCADHWHDNYNGAPTDGSVWESRDPVSSQLRVVRGGAWHSFPRSCRSSSRDKRWHNLKSNSIGFRVVWIYFDQQKA
ncbi:MAG: formylglycine-generating enzyme family protein [Oscillatoria sp. Prado101]|jgi:formylglycine-generating enzyme required for sulfatase activity|nr:formylglycine-generating enzyme family protein [Oscillatoria sp. Prado101]